VQGSPGLGAYPQAPDYYRQTVDNANFPCYYGIKATALGGLQTRMAKNTSSSSDDPDHHFAPPPVPSNTDYRHARWPQFSDTGQAGASATIHPTAQGPKLVIQNPKSKIQNKPAVLVVGVCSAGKSTLVRTLREAGYDARACAQEHSYVPHLWQLSNPGTLIYLDASLHTIRRRRKAKWQQGVLDEERHRLSHAREHCDLYISTDGLLPEDVASKALSFLRTRPAHADLKSET
jgi:hypothetical protein